MTPYYCYEWRDPNIEEKMWLEIQLVQTKAAQQQN